MDIKRLLPTVFGTVLFFGGMFVSLAFSAALLWGEMEARLYVQQSGEHDLNIQCPLMIAPGETAEIKAVVSNTLADQSVRPQVNAFISHAKEARVVSETVELDPLERRDMQWTVDTTDIVFEQLILVNVLQRPYRDLPSRQGVCSIFVYSLFGMNGKDTLLLIVILGVAGSLLGAGCAYFALQPMSETLRSFVQLNGIVLLLVLLGVLTTVYRWWGFTLALDAAALLTFAAGSIEIFFPRKK